MTITLLSFGHIEVKFGIEVDESEPQHSTVKSTISFVAVPVKVPPVTF